MHWSKGPIIVFQYSYYNKNDGDLIQSLSLSFDFQITNHIHVYESKLVKHGVHIYIFQAQYPKLSFKLSLMICKAVVEKLAEKKSNIVHTK